MGCETVFEQVRRADVRISLFRWATEADFCRYYEYATISQYREKWVYAEEEADLSEVGVMGWGLGVLSQRARTDPFCTPQPPPHPLPSPRPPPLSPFPK